MSRKSRIYAPGCPTQRFRQSRFLCGFRTIFDQFYFAFPDGCELHLESAANCHRLHPAQYDVTCNVLPLVSCQCYVILMPRGSGAKGRSPFSHIKSRQHKAHRLQSLEDVVSRELGAPYMVPHLPDTGHIMLTPVARGGGGGGRANPTAPSLWEKTVAAMWRTRSLHLSRTEAQYLTPHPVEGVPWEDRWATMQHLTQLASKGFVATTGEGVGLYGAVCPLPKRLQHLYSCRPVEPVHVQQPGDPRLH